MLYKLTNLKLMLLAFLFIGFFARLGFWQLSRAHEKKLLLQSFAFRRELAPLSAKDLLSPQKDLRFFLATLTGEFDNQHSLLLDNKTYEGKIGYEVYTPFKIKGIKTSILVDRGFVPLGNNRQVLPKIPEVTGEITLGGLLNLPPHYVAFGAMLDATASGLPLRVEFINVKQLEALFHYSLFPYVLNINPSDPHAYAIKWQIVTIGPERHLGYAVQWFALALTLLILSIVLNRRSLKK